MSFDGGDPPPSDRRGLDENVLVQCTGSGVSPGRFVTEQIVVQCASIWITMCEHMDWPLTIF